MADYVTGIEARDRRPPPDGVDVDYPLYPGAAQATDYLSWCSSDDGDLFTPTVSAGNGRVELLRHSGRIAPRWRRRSAVLGQNRRLASPCRATEGKRYQQEADELNPRHDGFHVHR
jgi:hypothetical protein